MALGRWIGRNAREGLRDSTAGAFGGLYMLMSLQQIASSKNKITEIFKVLKDMALFRLTWPLSLLAGITGVRGGIRALIKDTGSLEAALRRLATIKGLEAQFRGIMVSADAAKRRVAELMRFSAKSPFNIEGVGRANKSLEVMTKGMYSGMDAMEEIGRAAAYSGNQIDETASAVGALIAEFNSGNSIGQTVEEMRQMGLITASAGQALIRLQQSGAGVNSFLSQVRASMARGGEGIEDMSQNMDVLNQKYEEAKETLAAKFGAPFTEAELNIVKNMTTIMIALQPAAETLGKAFYAIAAPIGTVTWVFAKWIGSSSSAPKVINGIAVSLGFLAKGAMAMLVYFTAKNFVAWVGGFKALAASMAGGVGSANTFGRAVQQARFACIQLFRGNIQVAGAMGTQAVATGIAATALRGFALASRLAGMAVRGLIMAIPFGVIMVALSAAIEWVVDRFNEWRDGMSAAAKEAMEFNEATVKIVSALKEQADAIRTVEDRLNAVRDAGKAAREAMEEYAKIKADPKSSKEAIAAAKMRVEATNSVLKDAANRPVEATDEHRTAVLAQSRRDLIEEEAEYQGKMSRGTLAQQVELRDQRIATLQSRADQGKAAIEESDKTKTQQDEVDRAYELAKNEKIRSEQGVGTLATEAQAKVDAARNEYDPKARLIAVWQANKDLEKAKEQDKKNAEENMRNLEASRVSVLRESKSESMRATGDIQAAEAAMALHDFRPTGNDANDAARKAELGAQAGDRAGYSKEENMRFRDEAIIRQDKAKLVESNYEANSQNLANENQAQVNARIELEFAQRRLAAESEIADLKSRGVQRAQEEFAIKDRVLAEEAEALRYAGRDSDAEAKENERKDLKRQNDETQRAFAKSQEAEELQWKIDAENRKTLGFDGWQHRQKASSLGDQKSFLEHFEENRLNMGADEAKKRAGLQVGNEIQNDIFQKIQNDRPEVDNLQRVGGGGYQGERNDWQKALMRRQAELLRIIAGNTKKDKGPEEDKRFAIFAP